MSRKLADVLEDVVRKTNTKKKPMVSRGKKVSTRKPSNARKIEDMNE